MSEGSPTPHPVRPHVLAHHATFIPRAEHMGDQTRVDAEPAHRRTVAVARDDADPSLGTGHPPEGHRRLERHRRSTVAVTVTVAVLTPAALTAHAAARIVAAHPAEPPSRRLDEHHLLLGHSDVVLPRRALECHRLRPTQPAAPHPTRRGATRSRPPSLAPSRPAALHREEDPRPVRRHSMHVRRDRHTSSHHRTPRAPAAGSTARASPTRAAPTPTRRARTPRRRPPSRPTRTTPPGRRAAPRACRAPRRATDRRHAPAPPGTASPGGPAATTPP